MAESPQHPPYLCPGQQHPISRAVHLSRLAAFYAPCRQCHHRDDTGTLSARQVEQLAETNQRHEPRSLFHDEGAGGVYLNDLTPAAARDIAAAFGMVIRNEERKSETAAQLSLQQASSSNPFMILAGDGRPISAEITAAVGEGLRWSGCDVVDVGLATTASLAFAMHQLQAAGGVLVGNSGAEPRLVNLQFWAAGSQPISAGKTLDSIAQLYHAGVNRPARKYGSLCRQQTDAAYLVEMANYFHALRPLRVIVDSASGPLLNQLKKLAGAVACQIIPSRVTQHDLLSQIRSDAAHFAVCIDGDGEKCRALDEQGRVMPAERLLLLLAHRMLQLEPQRAGQTPTIVLEESTSSEIVRQIEQRGGRAVFSSALRASMAAAMREHNAILGGGPSGRVWHTGAGLPLPDALMTITRLLIALSRSDAPLSVVLDHDAPLV
jgi:phosphomannomutase